MCLFFQDEEYEALLECIEDALDLSKEKESEFEPLNKGPVEPLK